MEEPALLEIASQVADLHVREMHVAVPRHIEVRDVPQLRARQRHHSLTFGDWQGRPLTQRGQEVGQARGVRVPIAAAVVVQATYGERGGWAVRRLGGWYDQCPQCHQTA